MRCILASLLLIFSLSVPAAFAGPTTTIIVDGMTCASCARSIERQFKKFPEVESVDISIRSGEVTLKYTDSKVLTPEQIKRAVQDAGYSVKAIESH
ncbi:MAG: heavy-metal-associated domain-containing protein [Bacteriovoracia bacterium]